MECAGLGTDCLCGEANASACEFRSPDEVDFTIANEAGGNDCIARCLDEATCVEVREEQPELVTCIDACRPFLGPGGCWSPTHCGEGEACYEPADRLVTQCGPVDDLVVDVSVDPAPYAQGCTDDADCVVVPVSWNCGCETTYSPCGDAAVLASQAGAVAEALEDAKTACTEDFVCTDLGSCSALERAACEDSVCVLVVDEG